jgi:uncharacterized protein YaaW (UPF0174 family)
MSEIDIQGDEALVQLLLNADKGDIDLLIDYVTNTGKLGFSMSDSVKTVLQDAKRQDIPDEETLRLLVRELQHFGGNTFVNLFRRNGVNYSEIVDDVASHLKMKVPATASVEEKEALIIDCVFTSSWKKMSDDERSQILRDMGINGSASMDIPVWQRAALVANSLAQTTAGKVLPLIAGLGIGRVLGVLTGPVGLAITGLYTAYDISNPAFRVTLPCVVQIAWIRLKTPASSGLPPSHHQPRCLLSHTINAGVLVMIFTNLRLRLRQFHLRKVSTPVRCRSRILPVFHG